MPRPTSVNLADDVRYWLERYSMTFEVSMSAVLNEAFRKYFRDLSEEERSLMRTERRKHDKELIQPPLDIPRK